MEEIAEIEVAEIKVEEIEAAEIEVDSGVTLSTPLDNYEVAMTSSASETASTSPMGTPNLGARSKPMVAKMRTGGRVKTHLPIINIPRCTHQLLEAHQTPSTSSDDSPSTNQKGVLKECEESTPLPKEVEVDEFECNEKSIAEGKPSTFGNVILPEVEKVFKKSGSDEIECSPTELFAHSYVSRSTQTEDVAASMTSSVSTSPSTAAMVMSNPGRSPRRNVAKKSTGGILNNHPFLPKKVKFEESIAKSTVGDEASTSGNDIAENGNVEINNKLLDTDFKYSPEAIFFSDSDISDTEKNTPFPFFPLRKNYIGSKSGNDVMRNDPREMAGDNQTQHATGATTTNNLSSHSNLDAPISSEHVNLRKRQRKPKTFPDCIDPKDIAIYLKSKKRATVCRHSTNGKTPQETSKSMDSDDVEGSSTITNAFNAFLPAPADSIETMPKGCQFPIQRNLSFLRITNEDEYDDYCVVCQDGGEDIIVCCDLCPRVFHTNCHIPRLVEVPETFACNYCKTIDSFENEMLEMLDVAEAKRKPLTSDNPREFSRAYKFLMEVYKIPEMPTMKWIFPSKYLEKFKVAPYHLKFLREKLCLPQEKGQEPFGCVREFLQAFRQMFQQAFQIYKRNSKTRKAAVDCVVKFQSLFEEYYQDYDFIFDDIFNN